MLSYNVLNSWVEKMMKKSLPVKIKTSDITNLSTKDINKLKAGDIVLKKTGNQKHAYIVSYKEENQGICLTYNDALYTETVSYDYDTTLKTWVYNSTDKTVIQKELTAGDNITITDAGVISATDTTYTAGTGISITNGVISATGGGTIYQHDINIYGNITSNLNFDVRFKIFNTSLTAYTKTTIGSVIQSLASSKIAAMEANGLAADSSDATNNRIVIGIYSDNGEGLYLVNAKFTQMTSALNDDLSALSVSFSAVTVRDDVRTVN